MLLFILLMIVMGRLICGMIRLSFRFGFTMIRIILGLAGMAILLMTVLSASFWRIALFAFLIWLLVKKDRDESGRESK